MKNNIFNVAKFNTVPDFKMIFEIVIQCSKYSISTNIEEITTFPKISLIKNSSFEDKLLYDLNLLVDIQKEFDSIVNCKKIDKLTKNITSKIKSDINTDDKQELGRKRKKQKRILKNALEIFDVLCKRKSIDFVRSFKIYTATINENYLSFPPGRMYKNRFERLISNVKNTDDKRKLEEVYKMVGSYYCSQGRLNKNNFKDISRIIFEAKHT